MGGRMVSNGRQFERMGFKSLVSCSFPAQPGEDTDALNISTSEKEKEGDNSVFFQLDCCKGKGTTFWDT